MNNFEVVIGIEIHVELNTKTKMFSPAPVDFSAEPNTMVSPIDIGYPGTLPTVNKQAVIYAIKLAKALNMKIDDILYFDRKNYFYPDLPKGYQITQNERPIGKDGNIPLSESNIKIERIHLEEDTAKSIHKDNKTFLNYNRAGVPLIEIVTEPVIKDAKQAAEYVDAIRSLVLTLGISDAKMEEGSLRADINISLRPHGQKELGTKVEIKNLNSISNIEKAIHFEIESQIAEILLGKSIIQCTKRFDEENQKTVIMRKKTGTADYKYFPEPNIPPIKISSDLIKNATLPELPWKRKERYLKENIPLEYVEKLMSNLDQANYFDELKYKDKEKLAKIFFAEIISLANSKNKNINELGMNKIELIKALEEVDKGQISNKHLKEILPLLLENGNTVDKIIKEKGMKQLSNENELNDVLGKIIKDNEKFINENIDRKERVVKFILGQLMKETKGQANPVIANKLVQKKLGG